MMNTIIRKEEDRDRTNIYELNKQAFGSTGEADLINRLRASASPIVSLVAESDGEVIGHIVFTPVKIDGFPELNLMGLAPMAVAPKVQKSGVGSALVHAGLRACRELETGAVVVLGHIDYYPKFGFRPAHQFNCSCEFDVPKEAFMIQELKPGYLQDASGIIRYHPEFHHE